MSTRAQIASLVWIWHITDLLIDYWSMDQNRVIFLNQLSTIISSSSPRTHEVRRGRQAIDRYVSLTTSLQRVPTCPPGCVCPQNPWGDCMYRSGHILPYHCEVSTLSIYRSTIDRLSTCRIDFPNQRPMSYRSLCTNVSESAFDYTSINIHIASPLWNRHIIDLLIDYRSMDHHRVVFLNQLSMSCRSIYKLSLLMSVVEYWKY